MAYTSPPTFVNGNILTASQLNLLADDVQFLAGIAGRLTSRSRASSAGPAAASTPCGKFAIPIDTCSTTLRRTPARPIR
jgi:hypothetical protein